MNDILYHKQHEVAYRALKLRCNRGKAVERLMEDGVGRSDAEEIVVRIMSENRSHNAGVGMKALMTGLVILAVVYYLSSHFGRLYYVVLIVAAAVAAFGLLQLVWPTPYKEILSFDEGD